MGFRENTGRLFYKENNNVGEIVRTNSPINQPLVLGVEATGNYPNNSIWAVNNLLFYKDNSGNIHTINMT